MQGQNHFAYKNDMRELVDLCQFLRETIPGITVQREWYILFGRKTGKYIGYSKTMKGDRLLKPRNPDIMILDKKTKKLLLCVEIDGSVHDVFIDETNERNAEYEFAKVPLLVISKLEIETSLIDLVNRRVRGRLGLEL